MGGRRPVSTGGVTLDITIGLDLGDRSRNYCILDEAGEVILEQSFSTTLKGVHQVFDGIPLRSHGARECRTRVDEILWRATEEMRHRANESGDGQGTEPGVAGSLGTAVRRNRITELMHRRVRPTDRANRQGSLSPGGSAQ